MTTMRQILGLVALCFSLSAAAQTQGRIGWIYPSTANVAAPCISAFKDGMREQGMVEGKQYVLDLMLAEGDYSRFPSLTKEILLRNPSVIVGQTTASIRAAQEATQTVPILFLNVNDPVGSGLVSTLARPGGNTTGLSNQSEDLMTKHVELIREILPGAKRLAILFNRGNESNPKMAEKVRVSAAAFGIGSQSFGATSPGDIDAMFGAIARYKPDALLLVRDSMLNGESERIAVLARKQRLPTFGGSPQAVPAGILVSYAAPRLGACRRSAFYVKKILDGAKPADLPVEQPTTFELLINMGTAKALGLTIPKSVLARTNEVVQ